MSVCVGFTAVHLAVRGGHLSCVKLLVSLGRADVNDGDGQTGRTALHHAVLTDNLAIAGYLLLEVTCTDRTALNLTKEGFYRYLWSQSHTRWYFSCRLKTDHLQ